MNRQEIKDLYERITDGDRFALSRGITLLESTIGHDQSSALGLMLLSRRSGSRAHKIAISGAPGVGKSSFIEELGLTLVRSGHKVAVLAIDPSSTESGGSILGDKTRMPNLSRSASAYIRPSPNAGLTGGVGLATYECSELCRIAGYNFILIETVGAGQSEVQAKYASDYLIVLLQPGAGDDLQGIKRGLVEVADLLIVTKHDGLLKEIAEQTKQAYSLQIHSDLDRKGGRILLCSSHEKRGFDEISSAIEGLISSPRIDEKRLEKEKHRFLEKLKSLKLASFLESHSHQIAELLKKIDEQELDYLEAVHMMATDLKFLK